MRDEECLGKLNNWKNSDNYAYYDNVPIEVLQDFAVKAGFENGCDIDLIYDFLKDKESILEVGAAYGRVIKNILARGYQGKLYALERSSHLYQHLQVNFGDQAEIIHGNAQAFQPNFKVDVVLMLWAFIFDFAKLEQMELLRYVISWLKPNGCIILDTLPLGSFAEDFMFLKKQTYALFGCKGMYKVYGYVTSKREIDEYAKQLKIKFVEHLLYKTSVQKERILHILKI